MRGNKGQVVVEYVLMIAVVVTMITSLMALIKKRYLGDPSKCTTTASQKTLSCSLANAFNLDSGGGDKKFQYYPFKK